MNKMIKSAIILSLIYITAPLAYVLIMVDADYYNNSQLKVERFANDIWNYDGISSSIYPLITAGKTQFDVWFILRDLYAAGHGTSAPLEGVVMIGDIPATVFHYGVYTMACEYFFMDLWKSNVTPQRPYNTWDEVWDIYSGESVERTSYSYLADQILDIWVSRICASNLNYLRSAGAAWGNFLEEYQIQDNYFDRLHARMSAPAKVPHRGFALGSIPPVSSYGGLEHCAMNNLGLDVVRSFDISNLRLNQAGAWQAQLQAGPYGNNNYGASNGVRFTDANYKKDCRTSYSGTTGHEWAALFAHSNPTLHAMHMYDPGGAYTVGGNFTSVNTTHSWTKKTSGGYQNGAYYEWSIPKDDYVYAEWSCVIPSGKNGTYEVYMYWTDMPGWMSYNSYFNLFGGKNFSMIGEGAVDQNDITGWHKIGNTYSCSVGDTLVFRLVPNHSGFSKWFPRCVADALKFKKVSGTAYEIVVKPSNIFNISSRGTKGFRLSNWYYRSFCDMQDDGGQSKVPFFEIFGCSAGNYLVPDNVGLLYAMGHEGLSSIANSVPLYVSVSYNQYTSTLGNGGNFGSAYLAIAQQYFPGANENFILFGAGTLYSDPYIAYPY